MTAQQFKNLLIIPGDVPMYKDMFHIAATYNKSAKLIIQHSEKQEDVAFMFPSIVCQTFAIELLLKFFILVEHSNILCRDDLKKYGLNFGKKGSNGHAYDVLWDLIKPKYQELISLHYSNSLVGVGFDRNFRKALELIDPNAFTSWRYIHEGNEPKFMHHELTERVSDVLLSAACYGVMYQK